VRGLYLPEPSPEAPASASTCSGEGPGSKVRQPAPPHFTLAHNAQQEASHSSREPTTGSPVQTTWVCTALHCTVVLTHRLDMPHQLISTPAGFRGTYL